MRNHPSRACHRRRARASFLLGPCLLGLAPCLLVLGVCLLVPSGVEAQDPDPASPPGPQTVTYWNAQDSTYLTAELNLPAGEGPNPGVVLFTIAGTDRVVGRLTEKGYAVLLPVRRGFAAVEPLLQATFRDLAGDAEAALAYLRSRPEVDGEAVAVMAQGDDAPPAMLAAATAAEPTPLVLLAPPAFPGRRLFRLEQRASAERSGYGPEQLEALDRYVDELVTVVLEEATPDRRSERLAVLMATSQVELPFSASFPRGEAQIHHFSSPYWHDRFAFEPEEVLGRMASLVLLLIGNEDPQIPLLDYLDATRRGLSAAPSPDATVCLVPGRTRHSFTDEAVEVMAAWLEDRVTGGGDGEPRRAAPATPEPTAGAASAGGLEGCLPDPDQG